jgi:selenobiotic family peptide radical SAM maturase
MQLTFFSNLLGLRDGWLGGRKAPAFTLQWHLTNTCPNHCLHCYDRTARGEPSLTEALRVLEGLQAFCAQQHVEPRVCLTGGDPLQYRDFWDLYATIAKAGISVSILGNPIFGAEIHRLLSLQPPLYFQASLEGLREHNDHVRGSGHFERTMFFLEAARGAGLRTHVMLTLTRANLFQVIPLGDMLRGLTCRFTFNRLSNVGEGEHIETPTRDEFVEFLKQYLLARRGNPVFGVKDNLFNIIRHHFKRPLYPGCTGFGCGAAFNFVALLPDGEVHACRKYPSLIGHIQQSSFQEIYNSPEAARYRCGPAVCQVCVLRKSCGGCPAVVYGKGLDPLIDRDPYCFLDDRHHLLAGF